MRYRLWTWSHFVLILLPLAYIFAPLLVHGAFYLSEDLETLLVQYPLHHLLGTTLDSGRLPLWTPMISGGYPVMSGGEMGTMYPINVLLFRQLDPYPAYQVAMVLAPWLSMVAAYAYLSYRGRSVPASLVGAASFGLGGFALGHLRFLSVVQAMSMLPLALLFTERFLDRRRLMDASLLAACWGVSALAGSYSVTWLVGAGVVLVVACRGFEHPDPSRLVGVPLRWPRRRPLQVLQAVGVVPGALLLAGLLAAPQVMSTWDFLPLTTMAGGTPVPALARGSMGWSALVHVVLPLYHGIPAQGTYRGGDLYWETLVYPGWLPLALAVLAMPRRRRFDSRARVPWLLVTVGLVLALGVHTPAYRVARTLLPGLAWFGVPGRFLLLVQLGLAMLAAQGLDRVIRWLGRFGEGGERAAAVVGLAALVLTGADLGYHGSKLLHWMDRETLFEKLPSTAAIPGLGPLRHLALLGEDAYSKVVSRRHTLTGDAPLERELRALTWPEISILHGVNSASTSLPMAVERYQVLEKALLRALPRDEHGGRNVTETAVHLLHFLGVRVISSSTPLQSDVLVPLDEVEVSGLSHPIRLYGLTDPYPRAYLAHEVRRCGSDVALRRIEAGRFGMGWEPCGDGAPGEGPGHDTARSTAGFSTLTGRGLTFLEYEVNILNAGWLVVRETYAPGWVATVDGEETTVERVDLVYRAVPVPAGRHTVRFEYRPRGMSWGLLANLVGLLFVAFSVLPFRSPLRAGKDRLDPAVLDDVARAEEAEGEDGWFR